MSKRIRVALVMGGSVSLGSFSGGSVAQVVHQLSLLDQLGDVQIDVMCGASGGSITLALALHALANYGDQAPQRLLKDCEEAWVKRIDIERLVASKTPWRSILNRSAVDGIALDLLKGRANPRRNGLLAPRVIFHSTLTNMRGYPLSSSASLTSMGAQSWGDLALGEPLTGSVHKDPAVYEIHREEGILPWTDPSEPGRCFRILAPGSGPRKPAGVTRKECWVKLDSKAAWREVAGAAVGSGAFPGAFEAVNLKRHRHEYSKESWKELAGGSGRTSVVFSYHDGGAMDNEPLDAALRYCARLDHGADDAGLGDGIRLIVYIDPFMGDHIPLLRYSPLEEVSWKGSIGGKKNKASLVTDFGGMGRSLMQLVTAARRQMASRAWLQELPAQAENYQNNVLLLGVGPVEPPDKNPTRIELAGDEMGGFKGFLDERFRRFDFQQGKRLGNSWFREMVKSSPHFDQADVDTTISERDANGEDLKVEKLPRGIGNGVGVKHLTRRANALLKVIKVPAVANLLPIGIVKPLVKGKLLPDWFNRILDDKPDAEPSILVPIRVVVPHRNKMKMWGGARETNKLLEADVKGELGVFFSVARITGLDPHTHQPLGGAVTWEVAHLDRDQPTLYGTYFAKPRRTRGANAERKYGTNWALNLTTFSNRLQEAVVKHQQGEVLIDLKWDGSKRISTRERLQPWPA